MGRDWKPGDVAMVTGPWVRDEPDEARPASRYSDGWQAIDGAAFLFDSNVRSAHPLLIIDPAGTMVGYDPDDAMHYLPAWFRIAADKSDARDRAEGREPAGHGEILRNLASQIEAQIRPAKPDEPTGLGAVVEDADGNLFVRFRPDGGPAKWALATTQPVEIAHVWSAIDVARVLSEGVTP